MPRPHATVRELLAARRLDRIRPSRSQATDLLAVARRHVDSAKKVGRGDPLGAIALAYDAVRKAVAAHMAANGFRPANAPGAHRAVIDYAYDRLADALSEEQLAALDRMRRVRNQAEYEAIDLPLREAAWLVGHAADVVPALAALLEE